MTHTCSITGLTCDQCVGKVQSALGTVHGIQSAQVSLNPPQALVTMHHHVALEDLNPSVAATGNYKLAAKTGMESETNDQLPEHGQEIPAGADSHQGMDHAIGSGTDVAAETADIVLVDSDPKDIAKLILFGKATYRKMIQNLWWATGYNAVAVLLATGFIPG